MGILLGGRILSARIFPVGRVLSARIFPVRRVLSVGILGISAAISNGILVGGRFGLRRIQPALQRQVREYHQSGKDEK